ncbi:unnamed protein product [Amoebophrya sp. A120]|nr:unnamed protein product [Amoebophrya sp. A120]|eukprot:GSA120T00001577001.1
MPTMAVKTSQGHRRGQLRCASREKLSSIHPGLGILIAHASCTISQFSFSTPARAAWLRANTPPLDRDFRSPRGDTGAGGPPSEQAELYYTPAGSCEDFARFMAQTGEEQNPCLPLKRVAEANLDTSTEKTMLDEDDATPATTACSPPRRGHRGMSEVEADFEEEERALLVTGRGTHVSDSADEEHGHRVVLGRGHPDYSYSSDREDDVNGTAPLLVMPAPLCGTGSLLVRHAAGYEGRNDTLATLTSMAEEERGEYWKEREINMQSRSFGASEPVAVAELQAPAAEALVPPAAEALVPVVDGEQKSDRKTTTFKAPPAEIDVHSMGLNGGDNSPVRAGGEPDDRLTYVFQDYNSVPSPSEMMRSSSDAKSEQPQSWMSQTSTPPAALNILTPDASPQSRRLALEQIHRINSWEHLRRISTPEPWLDSNPAMCGNGASGLPLVQMQLPATMTMGSSMAAAIGPETMCAAPMVPEQRRSAAASSGDATLPGEAEGNAWHTERTLPEQVAESALDVGGLSSAASSSGGGRPGSAGPASKDAPVTRGSRKRSGTPTGAGCAPQDDSNGRNCSSSSEQGATFGRDARHEGPEETQPKQQTAETIDEVCTQLRDQLRDALTIFRERRRVQETGGPAQPQAPPAAQPLLQQGRSSDASQSSSGAAAPASVSSSSVVAVPGSKQWLQGLANDVRQALQQECSYAHLVHLAHAATSAAAFWQMNGGAYDPSGPPWPVPPGYFGDNAGHMAMMGAAPMMFCPYPCPPPQVGVPSPPLGPPPPYSPPFAAPPYIAAAPPPRTPMPPAPPGGFPPSTRNGALAQHPQAMGTPVSLASHLNFNAASSPPVRPPHEVEFPVRRKRDQAVEDDRGGARIFVQRGPRPGQPRGERTFVHASQRRDEQGRRITRGTIVHDEDGSTAGTENDSPMREANEESAVLAELVSTSGSSSSAGSADSCGGTKGGFLGKQRDCAAATKEVTTQQDATRADVAAKEEETPMELDGEEAPAPQEIMPKDREEGEGEELQDEVSEETWARRCAARRRQVEIGLRRSEHQLIARMDSRYLPEPPSCTQESGSKRKFDRALSRWRRKMHFVADHMSFFHKYSVSPLDASFLFDKLEACKGGYFSRHLDEATSLTESEFRNLISETFKEARCRW